jgi:rhodanese-related sulfurtransferase
MSRVTIAELLTAARARLTRLGPEETARALDAGALLVDVRSESQRARDGIVPGSSWHSRNVLEWRLDPSSEAADPALAHLDAHVVLMCDEGYQSSLAAATLQDLGFARATDLDGGFQAWRAAGLPVVPYLA